jgi:hypothetical protein
MPDPAPTPDPTTDPPTPTELGDAGKKALDAERDARKAAEARAKSLEADAAKAKTLEAELAKLREGQMSEQEKAIKVAVDTAAAEADKRWLGQIVRAEAKAAAAGKVVDVDTAVQLLDLSSIPVKDGEVDSAALAKAIDALVEAKPFLKPSESTPGKAPTPTVPGGPRNDGKGSITREHLKTMKPEAIEAARVAGELDHLLKG